MCVGSRLVADFVAGTDARPNLPELAEEHLTATTDGLWVVWAYKLARQEGDLFIPLTGHPGYPADARATCRYRGAHGAHAAPHAAPDPKCTCGFHALSNRKLPRLPVDPDFRVLTVALTGRILAFQWDVGGVLWRAERQTVLRIERDSLLDRTDILWDILNARPDDPEGRLEAVHPEAPRDSGPIRLTLPASAPMLPVGHDDAGWCLATSTPQHLPAALVLA